MGLLIVGTLAVARADTPADFIRADAGLALFAVVLFMWFAPKIATVLDVLTRPRLRRAFGGGVRFVANVAIETLFFLALSPIMWLGHTIFLGGLAFGRTIGWIGQTRDDHAVPLAVALRQFWPQTLLGWAAIGILALTHPSAIPYAVFIAGGLALSVPLAVVSAWPRLGRLCARIGVGACPGGPIRRRRCAASTWRRWKRRQPASATPRSCAPRVASCARSASITATAAAAPPWTGCTRNS